MKTFRMIGLMSPEESWVARWQRIGARGTTFFFKKYFFEEGRIELFFLGSFKRGCYAVSVSGELPRHIAQELRSRGVRYQSRDRTAKMK